MKMREIQNKQNNLEKEENSWRTYIMIQMLLQNYNNQYCVVLS